MSLGVRRLIKPRQPVLNKAHPITNRLQVDFSFHERGSLKVSDNAGKLPGTILNAPWINDRYGSGLSFTNTDSVVVTNVPTGNPLNAASMVSYEFIFSNTGLGGGSIGYVFIKGNVGHHMFVQMTAGPKINVYVQYATLDGTWSFPTTTDGTYHHVVITMNYGTTAGNAPVCYQDGVLQTLTVGDVASGAISADDPTLWIGNNATTAGTRNFGGQILYLRGWNRILGRSEVEQLYANPWCIYNPPNVSGDLNA